MARLLHWNVVDGYLGVRPPSGEGLFLTQYASILRLSYYGPPSIDSTSEVTLSMRIAFTHKVTHPAGAKNVPVSEELGAQIADGQP